MQLSIDFTPRRARRRDPATSQEAAMLAVLFIPEHQRRVLAGLRALGRAGAEQIGQAIGMEPYAVRKRISELERAGLIRDTGATRKTASGRSERVWEACR